MRLIPRQTKVKVQFFKNFSIMDAVIAFIGVAVIALILATDLSFKLILAAVALMFFVVLYIKVAPETRLYQSFGDMVKFLFGVRTFRKDPNNKHKGVYGITPYVGVTEDGLIDYKDYYGAVIEIHPVEFYMLTENRQNTYINAVDNALKTMSYDQSAAIVKLQRPMVLDSYINNEYAKADELVASFENKMLTEHELRSRLLIFESRVAGLEQSNVG